MAKAPLAQALLDKAGLVTRPWSSWFGRLVPATAVMNVLTVGTSPWVYLNGDHFTGLTVTGGTTTKLEYSTDAVTWADTGITVGLLTLLPGDSVRVTFSAPPTVTEGYRVSPS